MNRVDRGHQRAIDASILMSFWIFKNVQWVPNWIFREIIMGVQLHAVHKVSSEQLFYTVPLNSDFNNLVMSGKMVYVKLASQKLFALF